MKWLRRVGYAALALAVAGAGAYYWLIVDSSAPGGAYVIDIAEVRRLASSLPGEQTQEIRVERIAGFAFPLTAMVAGEGWHEVDVPVYSYQLAFPSGTVVIDAAIDGTQAAKAKDPKFDPDAYARMQRALESAQAVVVTHEHFDHIGGIVSHPNLASVLAHTKLTQEQIDYPEKMAPLKWPAGALDDYAALSYERYLAIAPGVVLIKARGHTPGTQMVFVRRGDGREYLFLGDVAWRMENVERSKTRARLVSWYFLGEERDEVMRQIVELNRLRSAEPGLVMVPGHDGLHMEALLAAGVLVEGFK